MKTVNILFKLCSQNTSKTAIKSKGAQNKIIFGVKCKIKNFENTFDCRRLVIIEKGITLCLKESKYLLLHVNVNATFF